MKDERENLFGLTLEELEERIVEWDLEKYRARQIYHWAFAGKVGSFGEMTSIPAKLRRKLSEKLSLSLPHIEKSYLSKDGTEKFLLRLHDGKSIESVLIPEKKRITICVSSQIGCPLNCTFCLTGKMGFKRNLETEEITAQIILLLSKRAFPKKKINVVMMGMGEPFLNYDNVTKFISIVTNPEGMGLSRKRLTLSTAGLPHEIDELSLENVKPKLSISLNATTNATRSRLMPINKKHNIESILKSCRNYFIRTSDRITFEYILIEGINDNIEDVRRLVKLLHGIPSKVNIIPLNESKRILFKKPPHEKIKKFRESLVERGIDAMIRKSRGDDIQAACGQLIT
ncbi:MAG: 23S rRNA (adenine(2503)-C(2))-methyltransferase RlmN [Acidobacteriota bacterium]